MGTITCPEIRSELNLTPKGRAEARDSFVRSFERQFADWTEIAKVCIEVDRDKDYLLLGFSSWHSWLIEAAPRSRSYIYLVVGRYKELSPDIPDEDLAQIPITATTLLRKVSSKVRQSSNIRHQAKNGSVNELRNAIEQEFPEQHLEGIVEQRLRFTTSQWERIEAAYEAYRVVDSTASLEVFFEWLVSEVQ